MSSPRFKVSVEPANAYQLAAIVDGIHAANVPVELDAEARAALQAIGRWAPKFTRTDSDARARATTITGAERATA